MEGSEKAALILRVCLKGQMGIGQMKYGRWDEASCVGIPSRGNGNKEVGEALNVLHPTERESLYFWLWVEHPKEVDHDEYKGKPRLRCEDPEA